MENKHFDWIPFYMELAETILEYKNKRNELVEFIFAEDGLRDFSNYLHLQDKNQKINDIDPFSFIGIFNRGTLSISNRIKILEKIKERFKIKADIPSNFDGIPVSNYSRMFFYNWNDFENSCNRIWEAFEAFMNGNLDLWFNYNVIAKRNAVCTIPLFWCKPNDYIALDSRNVEYLKQYGIEVKVNDTKSYFNLLQEIRNKMDSGEINASSFADISFKAWSHTNTQLNISISEQLKMNSIYQEYVTLLRSTHNLILTGAPGTGKTYLARQIADAMGAEVGFVQFHPSYDYTDFVEGLRPIQDDNGNVGFERKDGVFKAFCKKALKTSTQKEDDIFDKAWDALLNQIREGIANEKLIKIGSWEYSLSKFDSLKYTSSNSPSKYTFTITKQNIYDVYQGKKARPSGGYQKDMQDIVDYMQTKFNLAQYVPNQEQKKGFCLHHRRNQPWRNLKNLW